MDSCLDVKMRQGPSRRDEAGRCSAGCVRGASNGGSGTGALPPRAASRLRLQVRCCAGRAGLQRCHCGNKVAHCHGGGPVKACHLWRVGAGPQKREKWISCCAKSRRRPPMPEPLLSPTGLPRSKQHSRFHLLRLVSPHSKQRSPKAEKESAQRATCVQVVFRTLETCPPHKATQLHIAPVSDW